jgi:hypothetical protein
LPLGFGPAQVLGPFKGRQPLKSAGFGLSASRLEEGELVNQQVDQLHPRRRAPLPCCLYLASELTLGTLDSPTEVLAVTSIDLEKCLRYRRHFRLEFSLNLLIRRTSLAPSFVTKAVMGAGRPADAKRSPPKGG